MFGLFTCTHGTELADTDIVDADILAYPTPFYLRLSAAKLF